MTAALRLPDGVQEGVQLRMVGGAHLHRPRPWVGRVDVVAVNGPAAAAGGVPEEELNDAAGARQLAPRGGVVYASHKTSLSAGYPLRWMTSWHWRHSQTRFSGVSSPPCER